MSSLKTEWWDFLKNYSDTDNTVHYAMAEIGN